MPVEMADFVIRTFRFRYTENKSDLPGFVHTHATAEYQTSRVFDFKLGDTYVPDAIMHNMAFAWYLHDDAIQFFMNKLQKEMPKGTSTPVDPDARRIAIARAFGIGKLGVTIPKEVRLYTSRKPDTIWDRFIFNRLTNVKGSYTGAKIDNEVTKYYRVDQLQAVHTLQQLTISDLKHIIESAFRESGRQPRDKDELIHKIMSRDFRPERLRSDQGKLGRPVKAYITTITKVTGITDKEHGVLRFNWRTVTFKDDTEIPTVTAHTHDATIRSQSAPTFSWLSFLSQVIQSELGGEVLYATHDDPFQETRLTTDEWHEIPIRPK